MSSNADMPAFKCRHCSALFDPAPWQIKKYDYQCKACRRLKQNMLNKNDPLFKEKRKERNQLPHVKEYNSSYWKAKNKEPLAALKRKTRRKTAWALEIGKINKSKCRDCESTKTEMHHIDYNEPLKIVWLCRKHHAQVHRI